jgi:hypothetical protein
LPSEADLVIREDRAPVEELGAEQVVRVPLNRRLDQKPDEREVEVRVA